MLTDYSLDTEEFRDIMDEAKNMVVSLYPEWTDFNYHDPGITMLELFAWIKEGQQFYMDQIGAGHKRKYMKLLGMELKHSAPAVTYVTMESKEEMTLPEGTRLLAGTIPFTLMRRQCVTQNKLIACFTGRVTGRDRCEIDEEADIEHIYLHPFGDDPKPGSCFYMGFENKNPTGERVGIFMNITNGKARERVRLNAPLPFPMMLMICEYYGENGWTRVEGIEDGTFGIMQSGMIYVTIDGEMVKTKIAEKEGYFIRVRLLKASVDFSPIINYIMLNVFQVLQLERQISCKNIVPQNKGDHYEISDDSFAGICGQNFLYWRKGENYYPVEYFTKRIVSKEYTSSAVFNFELREVPEEIMVINYEPNGKVDRNLGIGTGLPYQEYDLKSCDVIQDHIKIMVHEIGTGNGFRIWQRVEDFGASGSEDRHFVVDRENGKIIFGDCERGMAPEGDIILISYATTLGDQGNVKKGTLNKFADLDEEVITVINRIDAFGGTREETMEECFYRAQQMARHPMTAITNEDYEKYVMTTPGLILDSCKVLSSGYRARKTQVTGDNTLTIVVKPGADEEKTDYLDFYRRNILAHLEKYRMVGTKIDVAWPRYIDVEVALDIVVKPHFVRAREEIDQAVKAFFAGLEKQFGSEISYSDLYGVLDMLECVDEILDITIDVRDGKVKRGADGNFTLPENGVIKLGGVQYIITMAG